MTLATTIFAPLLQFLAGQNANEAKAPWTKGPTTIYRSSNGISVTQYAGWLSKVESSPALSGSTPQQIAQRIRRLYFSSFTETQKPGVGERSDSIIDNLTPFDEPPLTTDHVDQATLDGLYGTSTIVTARGIAVDVGHLWLAIDLALAGADIADAVGEIVYLDSALMGLFTWTGDLGAVANNWSQQAANLTEAAKSQEMLRLVNERAPRDDLLGDMDGVILARHWDSAFGTTNPLVISREFSIYYKDDAMPPAQAKMLTYPNSARRFHHFLKVADPSLPASGTDSSPLEVSVVLADLANALKPIVSDAADDIVGAWYSTPDNIDRAGRSHFDKLCDNFAKFLETGLATGMADWPPNPW